MNGAWESETLREVLGTVSDILSNLVLRNGKMVTSEVKITFRAQQ